MSNGLCSGARDENVSMNLVMDPVRVARPMLILNVQMSFSHGSELVVGSSSAVSSVTGSGTSMDPPQFQGLQFFSQVLAPGRILFFANLVSILVTCLSMDVRAGVST